MVPGVDARLAAASDPRLGAASVAVVGGGPAGLVAAEVLAGAGASVTVFERMPSPGRKLLLAGRGGLNLTHSEPEAVLLERYRAARERLAPAVAAFGQDALRSWCAGLGVETFVGSSGRVFPVGLRATSLLRAWLRRLDELGVRIRTSHTWTGWDGDGALTFVDGTGIPVVVRSDATVLAMGGASWPRTGSDGSWVGPVAAAGVRISPLRPANCGFDVAWSAPFRERHQGAPVKHVLLSHGDRRALGEALVSARGIEGGAVYALADVLRDAIEAHVSTVVTLDLRPDLSVEALVSRLARARPRDSSSTALRRAGFAPVHVGLLREVTGNRLPRGGELATLAGVAKALPLTLVGPYPIARAISTAGGVALDEVDGSFMLRRCPGTFVAGEMLDWEAPTGGYLLQGAFSTGVAAAAGVQRWLLDT